MNCKIVLVWFAVYLLLSRLGLTHKKLQCIVLKHSEDSRAEFREEMNCINAHVIVWIDETASETGTDRRDANRRCGYHLRGITHVSHTLSIRGKRLSAITALSTRGIEDIHLTEGTREW